MVAATCTWPAGNMGRFCNCSEVGIPSAVVWFFGVSIFQLAEEELPMPIVVGVDFGTLSVRASVFDSERGRLGSSTAGYPLLRTREDPNHAAQRHADLLDQHGIADTVRRGRQRERGHRGTREGID